MLSQLNQKAIDTALAETERLSAVNESLLDTLKFAERELHHAPCRANIQHTHCLRCRALAQVRKAIAEGTQ